MDRFGHSITFDYGPSSCNPEKARTPGIIITCDIVAWLKFDAEWIKVKQDSFAITKSILECEDEIELLELFSKLRDEN